MPAPLQVRDGRLFGGHRAAAVGRFSFVIVSYGLVPACDLVRRCMA